jgi:hypothetical protein
MSCADRPSLKQEGEPTPDKAGRVLPRKPRRPRHKSKLEIERVDVQDPDRPGKSITVSRNRRVDILEYEFSHHRISREELWIGRLVQGVYERQQQNFSSRPRWEPRVDASPLNDLWILHRLDDAKTAKTIEDWLIGQVGATGTTLLRKLLVDGLTYSDIAKSRRLGKDGPNTIAKLFRIFLEDLASAWRVSRLPGIGSAK